MLNDDEMMSYCETELVNAEVNAEDQLDRTESRSVNNSLPPPPRGVVVSGAARLRAASRSIAETHLAEQRGIYIGLLQSMEDPEFIPEFTKCL